MLDLAKLDHGVESVKVHTSIKKLVETCLLSYDAIFFEHGIEIETEMPQDVQVVCDPDALRRLLVILLDNAVKYTDQGGKVEVRLGTERHKKMVLSVRNTGEGIPEDRLDAIFDRFVRLEDSRAKESGGYGLGLAIARSIAGQQGGYLKATSLMGEWTQMTLTLPL
jgi:signal transduction histidine kinase